MKKLRYAVLFVLVTALMVPVTVTVLAKTDTARRPTVSIEKITEPGGRLRDGGLTCHVDCEGDGPPYEYSGTVPSLDYCLGLCEGLCGSPCYVQ